MRALVLLAGAAVCAILPLNAFTNSFGAPAGRTGSPADGGQTCNAAGCHAGNALNSGGGSITVVGPDTYEPGETIELAITVERGGAGRIGFQVSVLDGSELPTGTLQVVDSQQTQFASNNTDYVTHRGAPTGQSARTFRVGWQAPDPGVGSVTFYVTGNAANGDFTSSGDFIYTKTWEVQQASGVDAEPDFLPAHFSLAPPSPNPASGYVDLHITLPSADPVSARVVDLLGREVASVSGRDLPRGTSRLRLGLGGAAAGLYLVVVETRSGVRQSRPLTVIP